MPHPLFILAALMGIVPWGVFFGLSGLIVQLCGLALLFFCSFARRVRRG